MTTDLTTGQQLLFTRESREAIKEIVTCPNCGMNTLRRWSKNYARCYCGLSIVPERAACSTILTWTDERFDRIRPRRLEGVFP